MIRREQVVDVPLLGRVDHPQLVTAAAVTIPTIKEKMENLGGTFGAWSALRLYSEQASLRARWEAWSVWKKGDQSGPKPSYQAYATKPGGSWHEAGRAVDFAVFEVRDGRRVSIMGFDDVDPEEHLEVFWAIVKPLGWVPIINKPSLNMEECWHFEYRGIWADAVEQIGYRTAVKAAILDIGNLGDGQDSTESMFIQAQLLRLGRYEIGRIDGIMGEKTMAALDALGVSRNSEAVERLKAM